MPMFYKVPACSDCTGVNRLPTLSSHFGTWFNVRTEVLGKRYMQLHRGCSALRSVHVDDYMTSFSESGKNMERLTYGECRKEWASSLHSTNEVSNSGLDEMWKSNVDRHDMPGKKSLDVTTLGNLCLDIVLNVPSLPPTSLQERFNYITKLAESAPDERYWEAGGTSNVAIAAARLGLRCVALGHFGDGKYGRFLNEVLEDEGVQVARLEDDKSHQRHKSDMEETVICWVLVDSEHQHGFCSLCDFNKDPVFNWLKELPLGAKAVIQRSKVLFCNGFLFDELLPAVIASAVDFANKSGCVVFFDPGPRGKSLFQGSADQQQALQKILSLSDVLLLTVDEAEALTGVADPVLSAKNLLDRGQCTKWVIIKMGEKGCLMATAHAVYRVPAFKVDVKDTVGCGDSFAAAIVLGYTQGLPVVCTLALANAVGAATAMGCGAGRNVATMDDVTKILLRSMRCNECGEDWKIQTFSMEHLINTGMTGHVSSFPIQGVNCAALSIPFQIVSRETVNLLRNSTQNHTELRMASEILLDPGSLGA